MSALLVERAPSEGPRPTRAVEDKSEAIPWERERASSEGSIRRIERRKGSRATAAKARALLLTLVKRRLAQPLVPFRLIVEWNVEQAAPPVRTGRGASLGQGPNKALVPAAAVTTVLERIERASLGRRGGDLVVLLLAEQRRGWSLMIFCARATRGLRRPSLDARSRRPIRPHL